MSENINNLRKTLKPLRDELISHPMYAQVRTLEDFRLFMQHHVFAVWDFMTQLKALQRRLTGIELPWIPQGDNLSRRLINEIVLEEESDHDAEGNFMSHFELYLNGMVEAGADSSQINELVEQLSQKKPLEEAVSALSIPESVSQFLLCNWQLVQGGKTHEIAAAFTFGREDLIPDMFRRILNELTVYHIDSLETLKYYLERHINLDEEHHNPMALKMLAQVCGDDTVKWEEAAKAAALAMQARLNLWNGVYNLLLYKHKK